ncbi:MAG: peptidoglycan-binding protein [Rhodobacteraceae bacterium]|nr:peptidoglycan-binding protein [Paracoccaceae bacterium]
MAVSFPLAHPATLRALLILIMLAGPAAVFAQSEGGAANALFVEAVRGYRAAQSLDDAAQSEALLEVRQKLDRILAEHPESAVAERLRTEPTPAGMDLASLPDPSGRSETEGTVSSCIASGVAAPPSRPMAVLAQIDMAGRVAGIPRLDSPTNADAEIRAGFLDLTGALDSCAPLPDRLHGQELRVALATDGSVSLSTGRAAGGSAETTPPDRALPQGDPADAPKLTERAETGSPALRPASEADEAALGLDRQAIRDLQARLLVSGFDPNGVDGKVGRGTRAALRAWQTSVGADPTGFLNSDQQAALATQSEQALAAWRANPDNERLYLPPPPIALGPRTVSGTWRFTSTCGAKSRLGKMRITGTINVGHAGGNSYTGNARQSQGLRGKFAGRLTGRQMSARINWGLLVGRVDVTGSIAERELVMRGRDSNGCSFYAAKG